MTNTTKISMFVNFPLTCTTDLVRVLAGQAMWTWFLVPLGLPHIGLAHMYGLLILWYIFRGTLNLRIENDLLEASKAVKKQTKFLAIKLTAVFCAWGVAALAHNFMS